MYCGRIVVKNVNVFFDSASIFHSKNFVFYSDCGKQFDAAEENKGTIFRR